MRSSRKFFQQAVAAFMLLQSLTVWCQSASPADADAMFQSHQWAAAAQAYSAVTKTEPNNARAWYRLGVSLLSLGRFADAAASLETSVKIGGNPEPMFALAQAYARLNDKDKAFALLNRALTGGLANPARIMNEANFTSLRTDARFMDLKKQIDAALHPCSVNPEHIQFDFWVGEWDVTSNGQPVAHSSIQALADHCIILENYSQADGYSGKSINFYDGSLRKWRQTWADSIAGVSEFSGEFRDGAMRFEGESHLNDGSRVLRRMTLFRLSDTQVRQLSHASTDGGKTWKVTYDFLYTRAK